MYSSTVSRWSTWMLMAWRVSIRILESAKVNWFLLSPFGTLLVFNYVIWRDRISRGFIFAISIGNYEKRTLNFATQVFSINHILFFKKSELIKVSRLSRTSKAHIWRFFTCRFSTPYVKSLHINVISQQKIQNGTNQ